MTTTYMGCFLPHLDKELLWVVDEAVGAMFAETPTVKRFELCETAAVAAGKVLIEREQNEGLTRTIMASEFKKLGNRIAGLIPDDVGSRGSYVIARYVAEAAVMYFYTRRLGMDTPYPEPSRSYEDNYDPFGNEGGFCNPYKLKMLHDDD